MRDRIYAERQDLVDFEFDQAVVRVFPDMIRRSVPGYSNVVAMTALVAKRHVTPATLCYDLGCSLGASTLAIQRGIAAPGCTIIAVDSSMAMIDAAREGLAASEGRTPIRLICADLRDIVIRNASLVLLQYTLQFIPPTDRAALLARIHAGMLPGGALVLSEKIALADPVEQDHIEALHREFKQANGYSALEIGRKRAALEKVLIPDTLEAHSKRLREVGFRQVIPWFRSLNFVSLIALP
jgi:tRNA (cmo5U34)-methyltransferase